MAAGFIKWDKGRLSLLLTAALVLLPVITYAGKIETIVSHLQKRYVGIGNISARFLQVTSSKGIKNKILANGKVFFKKPGKMRWEYSKPEGDLIVSDGRKIWIYQRDLDQVIEGAIDENSGSITRNLLAGIGNLKMDFDIRMVEDMGDSYRLELLPKAPQMDVDRLFLDVDKKAYIVKKTIVIDPYGGKTEVTFSDIRINRKVKDDIFKFKPPEGVEVIRP